VEVDAMGVGGRHIHGLPAFRCAAFGKTFDAHAGTPPARLRHRERRCEYAEALSNGQTACAAACTSTPPFRRRHRVLAFPA
jgi:hypothetical protein